MNTTEGRAVNQKTVKPVFYGDEISLNGCAPIPSAGAGLDGVLFRMEGAQVLEKALNGTTF